MKTGKGKKTGSAKSSNKNETRLHLIHSESKSQEQPTSKYQAGDMDMLERNAEKPLPAAFEQFDRTYKTVHSLFGWPLPIV
ncbi:MAG: hypothetical protein ACXWIN_06005 [Burkholderiaceae bacterium]